MSTPVGQLNEYTGSFYTNDKYIPNVVSGIDSIYHGFMKTLLYTFLLAYGSLLS